MFPLYYEGDINETTAVAPEPVAAPPRPVTGFKTTNDRLDALERELAGLEADLDALYAMLAEIERGP